MIKGDLQPSDVQQNHRNEACQLIPAAADLHTKRQILRGPAFRASSWAAHSSAPGRTRGLARRMVRGTTALSRRRKATHPALEHDMCANMKSYEKH